MNSFLVVLGGGGAVSFRRYFGGRAFEKGFPNLNFGLATFFVNVTGSFLIGVLMTLLVERLRLPHYWQLIGVVGFLGGYTTFSSFEYDGYLAARGGHHLTALTYLVSSVVLGYAGVWLGASLVTKH